MNYKEAAAACTRGEAPVCTAACPFNLDIRNLTARAARGRFDAVYRQLRDSLLFPETALKLCPAPCMGVCERNLSDAPVNLREIELAAINLAKKKEPLRLNLPPKTERIAVIGAGLSGLACALLLSSRRYKVTVYEKSDKLGGNLWEIFPDGAFVEEIELQFKYTDCEFKFLSQIPDDPQADAIFAPSNCKEVIKSEKPFSYGAVRLETLSEKSFFYDDNSEGVFAIKKGIEAASAIEAFLKTGIRTESAAPIAVTRLDPKLLVYTPSVMPSSDYYTKEEAVLEAGRCMRCDCDACARRCPLINHFKRFPKRIAEETEGTVYPLDIFVNRLATRMVASCDQCGMCAEACPQNVDIRSVLGDAKREMTSKGEFPKAFSAFWLDDMAHAGHTSFILKPDGIEKPGHMFFPGCQLGAAEPRYVSEIYKRLLKTYPDTAILADCCGAPAFWAGDMALYEKKATELREKWTELGFPQPVCACPTCAVMLKNVLPDCEPISLYSLDLGEVRTCGTEISVFDPCSSRFDSLAQDDVRRILENAGFTLRPLDFERENTLCCGWGGQYMIANPRMSKNTAERAAKLADTAYVTYCVNCAGTIAGEGKYVLHILDVLLGINESGFKKVTHSERRKNREVLKKEMDGELFAASDSKLYIDEALRNKLSADWILEKDVLTVVLYCENNNKKLVNTESGTFIGHLQLGYQTYWAEYKPEGNGYRLINAYTHRLVIMEEH